MKIFIFTYCYLFWKPLGNYLANANLEVAESIVEVTLGTSFTCCPRSPCLAALIPNLRATLTREIESLYPAERKRPKMMQSAIDCSPGTLNVTPPRQLFLLLCTYLAQLRTGFPLVISGSDHDQTQEVEH